MPPAQSSIGILATAISRLESNPHPLIFDELTEDFVEKIALDLPFPLNVICSNIWIFKPLIKWVLSKGMTKSMIQTTTAVTMIHGGLKSNVIPPSAWAIVNHRIHPSQTIQQIIDRDIAVINDDRVHVEKMKNFVAAEAHPVSPHDPTKDWPYHVLEKSVRQIYPKAVALPVSMVANTDTRHFLDFTKHIFRHNPVRLHVKELSMIHGRDEFITRSSFESSINFFYHLMLNANEKGDVLPPLEHTTEL
nr:N-fatty-acyl-amino acid synthase/hydrolase PM20D1-like [Ciona intestinalis]|eukprot:XP_026691312.1 N-fatty-acyl-amino acid synthase/hydrolase PM20D1-like [Ciona intestinalis]